MFAKIIHTMIKGTKWEDRLEAEEIFRHTNNGYDIYMYYIGEVKRSMRRPWGEDNKASWGVFPDPKNGVWKWKDFATEESGTAIQLVEKKFGLSNADARKKICYDFGLKTGSLVNISSVIRKWVVPDAKKDYCEIDFETKPFKQQHHNFWNAAEVTERDCNFLQCFAVKSLAVNKRFVRFGEEPVFAFWAPEEKAAKIYFPHREKGKKFLNNVPFSYLWNYGHLKPSDKIIVQKSPKDMIVTALIAPHVVATQNESVKVFTEEIVNKIERISKDVIMMYGSDEDGLTKQKKVIEHNPSWRYFKSPLQGNPDVNDVYSFVTYYNNILRTGGLRMMYDLFKTQNII